MDIYLVPKLHLGTDMHHDVRPVLSLIHLTSAKRER